MVGVPDSVPVELSVTPGGRSPRPGTTEQVTVPVAATDLQRAVDRRARRGRRNLRGRDGQRHRHRRRGVARGDVVGVHRLRDGRRRHRGGRVVGHAVEDVRVDDAEA